MATLNTYIDTIVDNVSQIDSYLYDMGIEWTLVTKVLCGNSTILRPLLNACDGLHIHSIGDARIENLRNIKLIAPNQKTMYIKPPEMGYCKQIVRYADYSLNSSFDTIKQLDIEATRQKQNHGIIFMVEMGERREGIEKDDLDGLYEDVMGLESVHVAGVGTNLGCMFGVEPTQKKMQLLWNTKKDIEIQFSTSIDLVSGGSSITLPLIGNGHLPAGINHLRVGEAAFFGTSPYDNKRVLELDEDTFEFCAQIIEMHEKSCSPQGTVSEANVGHTVSKKEYCASMRKRALLDFGILDVDYKDLTPVEEDISFFGISSDMAIYALGDMYDSLNVGDTIIFSPNYMATAKLMNSRFIKKEIFDQNDRTKMHNSLKQ